MTEKELDDLRLEAARINLQFDMERKQEAETKAEKFDKLMDRLGKFLDKQEAEPPAAPIPQPIELIHPEGLDEVLEEMATSGIINVEHMRRIINAIRPVLEENARLKAGL